MEPETTQRHGVVIISFRHMLPNPLEYVDNVWVRVAAPIVANSISEVLSIARASGRIGRDHYVALLSENSWTRLMVCWLRRYYNFLGIPRPQSDVT